jgi:hypothetical protein
MAWNPDGWQPDGWQPTTPEVEAAGAGGWQPEGWQPEGWQPDPPSVVPAASDVVPIRRIVLLKERAYIAQLPEYL